MEDDRHLNRPFFQQRSNSQLAISTQLVQASATMRHVDDLFLWLASTIVQQLEPTLMQIWAFQASSTRQLLIELRVSVCDDATLPHYLVSNAHVAEVVESFLKGRRDIPFHPVTSYFSTHQTNLLLRFGLNFCFGHFLSSDALLPPREAQSAYPTIATPLSAMALFFVRNAVSQDLLSTTSHILEQSITIAKLRGFLLVPPGGDNPAQSQSQTLQALLESIPGRTQDTEALRSHNPFASVTIPDRHAARLHQAIDGRKTVRELITITRLNEKEIMVALRFLFTRGIIRFYETSGRAIDLPRFPDIP